LPVFSLTDFLVPILTHENLERGSLGFVAVGVSTVDKRSLTKEEGNILSEIWNVLKHCIHPEMDIVLPRMSRPKSGKVFFVVACSHQTGIEVLARRIQE